MESNKLPSQFQLNEKAGLQTLINLMEKAANGNITKVSFLNGKVRYDIQIPVINRIDDDPTGSFRIANVDSSFLNKPFENGFHYNSERDLDYRDTHKKEPRKAPLFTGFYPMSDIPNADPTEEELSFYVLIDPDGWRADFEKGYYNFGSKTWHLVNSDVKIDLEHGCWAYLPLVARDKKTKL